LFSEQSGDLFQPVSKPMVPIPVGYEIETPVDGFIVDDEKTRDYATRYLIARRLVDRDVLFVQPRYARRARWGTLERYP